MSRTLLCSLTALVVLSAGATASATTPVPLHVKQARFKATIEGVQTTTWTANHPSTARCDQAMHGSGSERVTFASTRPVTVKAFQMAGMNGPSMLGNHGLAVLFTHGWVKRSGTLDRAPVVPECAVGDGGGPSSEPPASDCGRKRIPALLLDLLYDPAKPNRIFLQSEPVQAPRFDNCPSLGDGWPVIVSRSGDHTIGQTLPARDLFDSRQGKMIVLGKGKVAGGSDGVTYTTRVNWTLTLTRLKGTA
jgi:hypothetical protein